MTKPGICKPLHLGGKFDTDCAPGLFIKILFGGTAYGLIEVIWRGYTHPSMVITGGICFALICAINRKFPNTPLILRSAACAIGITAVEFCVGMVVNRALHMEVWDYSDMVFDLMGQICPLYSFLWFLLCIPVSYVLTRIHFSAKVRNLKK